MPEAQAMTAPIDPPSIPTLDGWIENLMACKQLSEADVQRLCEKVCNSDKSLGRKHRETVWKLTPF